MVQAGVDRLSRQPPGLIGAVRSFDHWLKGTIMRWVAAPVQLALRIYVFFYLPFFNSGLTKFEVFPFLKPDRFAWNGSPEVSASAAYQFGTSCEFCFNIRIWGTEQSPLVQWLLPYPDTMALLAGVAEIVLPVLILVGFLTRLSALGLLAMTVVIQLVLPWGLSVHVLWAAVFAAILVLGPGLVSVDHLLGRAFRRG